MPAAPRAPELTRTNTSSTDERLVAAAVTFTLSDPLSRSTSSAVGESSVASAQRSTEDSWSSADRLPVISESHFDSLTRDHESDGEEGGGAGAHEPTSSSHLQPAPSSQLMDREAGGSALSHTGSIVEHSPQPDLSASISISRSASGSAEMVRERTVSAGEPEPITYSHSADMTHDHSHDQGHDFESHDFADEPARRRRARTQAGDIDYDDPRDRDPDEVDMGDATGMTGAGHEENSIYLPQDPVRIAEICRFDVGLEGGLPPAAVEPWSGGVRAALRAHKRGAPSAESSADPPPSYKRRAADLPLPSPLEARERVRLARLSEVYGTVSAAAALPGSKSKSSETLLQRALCAERKFFAARAEIKRLHHQGKHLSSNAPAMPIDFDLLDPNSSAAEMRGASGSLSAPLARAGTPTGAALGPSPFAPDGAAASGAGAWSTWTDGEGASASTSAPPFTTIWSPWTGPDRTLTDDAVGRAAQLKLWQATVQMGDLAKNQSTAVGIYRKHAHWQLRTLCNEAEGFDWMFQS